jgi:predicted RNA binding protein YcfA (HicA-like mRNA interferase family)
LKIPRDVSGAELARSLRQFGYQMTRQSGSHMRLTSNIKNSQHHVTVPAHDPIRVGTLSQILTDVATYLEVAREELIEKLFS